MKTRMVFRVMTLLSALSAVSCGTEDAGAPSGQPPTAAAPLSERLDALSVPSAAGARGPGVAALHEYLGRYGYFPSTDLAERYPAWRPLVAQPPRALDVFDERTTDAVRALQRSAGLVETGVVDQETLAIVKGQRCAVPDGIAPADTTEKFALNGPKWGKSTLTYRVLNGVGTITQAQAESSAAAAFGSWRFATGLTFQKGAPATFVDMTITFFPFRDDRAAATDLPDAQGTSVRIMLNQDKPWSRASTTPAGVYDLETVLLHEIGHALGLLHSSAPFATMYPFNAGPGQQSRFLDADDYAAATVLYGVWKPLDGCARDIGVNPNGFGVWVIGCGSGANGVLYKKQGSLNAWTRDVTGGAGVRVDVRPNGIPWITEATGRIFARSSFDPNVGFWSEIGGCGRDIGIGADDSIWVVGCSAGPDGPLHRLNRTTGTWDIDVTGGAGVNVTVDNAGRPWVTNSLGQVWVRSSNDPSSGSWTQLPNGSGSDIGIGMHGNYAWMLGATPTIGDKAIFAWNKQAALSLQPPFDAPAREQWIVKQPGGAVRVDVGAYGQPWFVNSLGTIFTSGE